jgi:hypothetical protein
MNAGLLPKVKFERVIARCAGHKKSAGENLRRIVVIRVVNLGLHGRLHRLCRDRQRADAGDVGEGGNGGAEEATD